MVSVVQSSSFLASLTIYCASRSKKSKRQKQLKHKQISLRRNPSFSSYPKSSPTPLLITQKPISQTKIQALETVIKDLESSIQKGITIDTDIFSSLLETCFQLKAIDQGIKLHDLIPTHLIRKNVGISSKLLRLYSTFGDVEKAHELFDQMPKRNVFAFPWNSLISGYAEKGQYEDAIAMFFQMEEEGVEPDRFTFPRALKACAGVGSVQVGEAVHRSAVRSGFGYDVFVVNALVDMYAKCGDIVKARRIFDKIANKDLISWNSMLIGYIRHGLPIEALEIFRGMTINGFEPDSISISSLLASTSSMKIGVQIHGWVIRHGAECHLSIANSLIGLYSKSGKLDQARCIFDNMPEKDIISWNSIISAHCKDSKTLAYFDLMDEDGVLPDKITFVSLLSACAHLGLVKEGENLFNLMRVKYGIRPKVEHYSCMVNLYGRVGLIDKAYKMVVSEMEVEASPVVWGALLYGCCVHGNVALGEIAAYKLSRWNRIMSTISSF